LSKLKVFEHQCTVRLIIVTAEYIHKA